MWGDDGVGIVMTLQDHEKQTDFENSAAHIGATEENYGEA